MVGKVYLGQLWVPVRPKQDPNPKNELFHLKTSIVQFRVYKASGKRTASTSGLRELLLMKMVTLKAEHDY